MVEPIRWRFHERQSQAWRLIDDPRLDRLLYGGAKGGGKSVFLCRKVYSMIADLITRFGIKPQQYPLPVGWIGRKRSVDFKKTTLKTWKQFIDPSLYQLHRSDQQIIIGGALAIDYGGLDNEEDINKFNSAEYGIIGVDQAEETTRDDVAVLRGSLRLTIPFDIMDPAIAERWRKLLPADAEGVAVKPKQIYTANPAPNSWLNDEFILSPPPDGSAQFVQALPSDNPFLPPDYIGTLRQAFGHRPELLRAYLDGLWDAFEDDDQIIKARWIDAACNRQLIRPLRRRFGVCDVARFGDDETVIYVMNETRIAEQRCYGQKDTMHTANVLHVTAIQNELTAIVVDGDGPGGGVVDRLREMSNGQYAVIEFNSAKKARKPENYENRRAEAWDNAAKMFAEGDIDTGGPMSPQLRGQLCSVKYKYRNGRLLAEKKEEVKKRLGRSPDQADAYVYGLDALANNEIPDSIDEPQDEFRRARRHRSAANHPMAL